MLSFNHLMREIERERTQREGGREREIHSCQVLWSFFVSDLSKCEGVSTAQVSIVQPQPAQALFWVLSELAAKASNDYTSLTLDAQYRSQAALETHLRMGGERERQIFLLLLEMLSSRGDLSHSRMKKLKFWSPFYWQKIVYLLFLHGYILWFDIIKQTEVKSFNKALCIFGIIIEQLCL